MVTFKYIVSGRVQGVGYRWFAKNAADTLEISGTVRNLHTGQVEVFAQGTSEKLDYFLRQLKQGPALARVDEVLEINQDISKQFNNFKVIG